MQVYGRGLAGAGSVAISPEIEINLIELTPPGVNERSAKAVLALHEAQC